jgi:ribonuclease HII
MQLYKHDNLIEVGVDEAGRGCLSGRVYAGAVIFPTNIDDDIYTQIKDSKKLSKKKRGILRKYIEEKSLAFGVGYVDEKEIDNTNILKASYRAMHIALDKINQPYDHILVDGPRFSPYMDKHDNFISYSCIPKGDNLYYSIAAASILAKVYHDEYIQRICSENPSLDEKYGWLSNMGYGTQKHMEGIQKHGTCIYHRKSFGPCKPTASDT